MASLKLDELVKLTWDDLTKNGQEPDDDGYVRDTLVSALGIMGFSIAPSGEIVDPRPAPPVAPLQQNVRYTGRRRR